jgi:hypothetical protein
MGLDLECMAPGCRNTAPRESDGYCHQHQLTKISITRCSLTQGCIVKRSHFKDECRTVRNESSDRPMTPADMLLPDPLPERDALSPTEHVAVPPSPRTPTIPSQHRIEAPDTQQMIREECDAIREMLLAKNLAYGNSALEPVRIFSRASPVEQILVRIDDKLSRLSKGHEYADEDTIQDLIGYFVLLRIARKVGK